MAPSRIARSFDELSEILSEIDSFNVGDTILIEGEAYSLSAKMYYRLEREADSKIQQTLAAGGAAAVVLLGPVGWTGAAAIGALGGAFLAINRNKKTSSIVVKEIREIYRKGFRVVSNSAINGLLLEKKENGELDDFISTLFD